MSRRTRHKDDAHLDVKRNLNGYPSCSSSPRESPGGLSTGFGGSQGALPPPAITATSLPTLSALDDTQTPADGYTAGAYASTAGTITGEVVTYLVNGNAEAANFDLQDGDVLQISCW